MHDSKLLLIRKVCNFTKSLECTTLFRSAFLIFAVLVLRVNDCRPYTPF